MYHDKNNLIIIFLTLAAVTATRPSTPYLPTYVVSGPVYDVPLDARLHQKFDDHEVYIELWTS